MEQIWLDDEDGEAEFGMTSEDAWIVCAERRVWHAERGSRSLYLLRERFADAETGDPMMQFYFVETSGRWTVRWRYSSSVGTSSGKNTGVGSRRRVLRQSLVRTAGCCRRIIFCIPSRVTVFFGLLARGAGADGVTPLVGRIQVSGIAVSGVISGD